MMVENYVKADKILISGVLHLTEEAARSLFPSTSTVRSQLKHLSFTAKRYIKATHNS